MKKAVKKCELCEHCVKLNFSFNSVCKFARRMSHFAIDGSRDIAATTTLFKVHINQTTWQDVEAYRHDFAEVIAEREKHRIMFLHRSPQIFYRDYLIDYLKQTAAVIKVTHCTLHLAVYLLDVFMDNHAVNIDRIMLLTNCCLFLACKFEEPSYKSISELNEKVAYPYVLQEYRVLEEHILKYFNWFLMHPTPAHYVHYYLQAALDEHDLQQKKTSPATIIRDMHLTIRIYLDKILDDVHYMQLFKPSLLAASIIGISRRLNGLDDWTDQLTEFTKYKLSDLTYTMNMLLQSFEETCPGCLTNENNIIT